MFAVVASIAMLVQFARNSHVVVAPDITRDLGVSPAALGGLSGALFLISAIAQIPGGVLIDRYGPRKTIPAMLLVAFIGAVVFAMAHSVAWLTFGRVLVGLGTAVVLMASIIACARWFDLRNFATVTGTLLGMSQFGNLLATAPMAALAAWIGWRGAFLVLSAFTLGIALLAALLLRDAPPGHAYHSRPTETMRQALAGVGEVLRIRALYPVIWMSFLAYATIACVLGLWGGPYLFDVFGLDTVERGKLLSVLAIGLVVGNTSFGWLNRVVGSPKRLVIGGALATIGVFAALAAMARPSLAIVVSLLAVLGVVGSFTAMIIAHGRTFYPDRLIGRGLTVVNTAVLVGVALWHWLTGLLVGSFGKIAGHTPPEAYRTMFGVLAVVLLFGLAIYVRSAERIAES